MSDNAVGAVVGFIVLLILICAIGWRVDSIGDRMQRWDEWQPTDVCARLLRHDLALTFAEREVAWQAFGCHEEQP